MALPQVASVTTSVITTASTSHVINMPATRPNGDLYVMPQVRGATGSVTLTGWTLIDVATVNVSSLDTLRLWYRYGSSEPASYTATIGSAVKGVAAVYRITSPIAASPVDIIGWVVETRIGTARSPSVIPTTADCMILRFLCANMSATDDTILSGDTTLDFVINDATPDIQLAGAHQAGPPAGILTGAYNWVNNLGSSQCIGATLAIKALSPRSRRRAHPIMLSSFVSPSVRGLINGRGRPSNWPVPLTGTNYWRTPVSGFTAHANTATLSTEFYNNGCSTAGNFNAFDRLFTYAIYYVQAADTTYTVSATAGNMNGRQIAWNDAWTVPGGTDNQIILLDLNTGESWNAWRVTLNTSTNTFTAARCNRLDTTANDSTYGSTPLNFYTGTGTFSPSRGIGVDYIAGLVTPEEIDRGVIGHALSVPVKSSKNTFEAPAVKSDGQAVGTIPEGTHYWLDVTSQQIEDAIGLIPNTINPGFKRFAKIVYTALNKYGFHITDTSGGAHLQFEANESAQSYWEDLGIWPEVVAVPDGKTYPRDIMDPLMLLGAGIVKALAP